MRTLELLTQVRRIVERKRESIKNRNFNIFKLLKLEFAEDKVHSAFIGNLLNPKGTHNKGDLFIKLFLKKIGKESFYSETKTVFVILEKYVGRVNLENKTGGFVDIYLKNSKGETICIENKINADLQPYQLERYLNHNKKNNSAVFLNLKQDKKVSISDEVLNSTNFKHITYANEIIAWLTESKNQLKETDPLYNIIESYLEITYEIVEVEQNMEIRQDLKNIIFERIEDAKEIYDNYLLILNQTRTDFQLEVCQEINNYLDTDIWKAHIGNLADKTNAQIWIKPEGMSDLSLCFGIESFSGKGYFPEGLIIGVFSTFSPQNIIIDGRKKGYWLDYIHIEINGEVINFNDDIFISKLERDTNYRNLVKETIKEEFKNYFKECNELIFDWYEKKSK